MTRTALATLAGLALLAAPARADILPVISDAPATYAPGQPFTFELRVPGVADFSAYSIELDFDTNIPNPNITLAGNPDPTQYPYPSVGTFQAGVTTVPGSTMVALTVSDSASPGVTTTPGVNDLIVKVTVTPGADFSGPITISVNPDTLLLDVNTELTPVILAPDPITVEQGAPASPVPTPAAWATFGLGGLLLAARRRVLRRREM